MPAISRRFRGLIHFRPTTEPCFSHYHRTLRRLGITLIVVDKDREGRPALLLFFVEVAARPPATLFKSADR
jgi:hypothetical protein